MALKTELLVCPWRCPQHCAWRAGVFSPNVTPRSEIQIPPPASQGRGWKTLSAPPGGTGEGRGGSYPTLGEDLGLGRLALDACRGGGGDWHHHDPLPSCLSPRVAENNHWAQKSLTQPKSGTIFL